MFKLMSSQFIFLVLLISPSLTFLNQNGFALAEEDAVEDEVTMEEEDEGEVEDEDDEGIVEEEYEGDSASPSTTDEEEETETIQASKEAETAVLFSSGVEPSVSAGKKSSAFIHFSNRGSSNFIITSIEGSFRYPQDYSYVIQNFSVITPNKMVDAGYEGSFKYDFIPGELSGGRSFGLLINVNYKDTEENLYRDAVFNQTIQVLENEEGVDAETFFMYLMLGALAALVLVILYHTVGGKSRRGRKRATASSNAKAAGAPIEMGTTNGPVDYSWIPDQTLKQMNKGSPSPRTRRSPRKRVNRVEQ